jgi:hypothetical protein
VAFHKGCHERVHIRGGIDGPNQVLLRGAAREGYPGCFAVLVRPRVTDDCSDWVVVAEGIREWFEEYTSDAFTTGIAVRSIIK